MSFWQVSAIFVSKCALIFCPGTKKVPVGDPTRKKNGIFTALVVRVNFTTFSADQNPNKQLKMIKTLLILGASAAVYAGPPCKAFEIDIDQQRFTSPTLDFEEIGLRITKKDHGFVGYLTDFGEEKVPFLHLPARRLHLHDPVGQRDLIWNRWDSINREWYRDPAVVIRCAPGLL